MGHKLTVDDDDDEEEDDDDDVPGKQAETDQSLAMFKAKHGSSISPVATMI